ncbi:MAG: nucleotidyltransferase family protein [Gammaproteobacteria bacterium]|nr:nucleotidyltransferase family protein [Gammaproteobacteria bacterium]
MNIVGLLLAAGAGTRFGADKRSQRLPDGDTLLSHSARKLCAVVDDVVVVLRPGDDDLIASLDPLSVQCCVNPHADDGMGSSLARGVATRADADGWLVMPVDLPLLRTETMRQVSGALRAGCAVVPVCDGRRGHPVALSARFGPELAALDGDRGARDVLRRHADAVTWLDVSDPGIYRDLDTAADQAALWRQLGGDDLPSSA